MSKIKRAIISVTDKKGELLTLQHPFPGLMLRYFPQGGTAKALRQGGVPVTGISDYTGFPEMMDGRVKTLHPKVHGGASGSARQPRTCQDDGGAWDQGY